MEWESNMQFSEQMRQELEKMSTDEMTIINCIQMLNLDWHEEISKLGISNEALNYKHDNTKHNCNNQPDRSQM